MDPMDRRGFLRSTAGGSAAIALASLLPAGCAMDYPQASQDGISLKALTDKEYAVVRAAGEALLDNLSVDPKTVAARIDAELAAVGEPVRGDFKTVLGLVQHLTFLGGSGRVFTNLNVPERLAYLTGWSRSRFKLRRGAFFALKGFIYYFAYIDPATRVLTGFTGAWPEKVKIAAYPIDFGPVS
jgi:hypothetical protein